MPDELRSLRLTFVLDSADAIFSSEFISFFQCVDGFSRAIAEDEARTLLEHMNVTAAVRLDVLQRLHRQWRRMPAPVEVTSVERGSWVVDAVLQSAGLLFILKEFVAPTLKVAWDDSRLRDLVVSFLRERVFLGAKRKAEEKAIEQPTFGNLRVTDVRERTPSGSPEPSLEIRLTRSTIVEVRSTDNELIEEFLKRFRNG
jgi:hypothetical protein